MILLFAVLLANAQGYILQEPSSTVPVPTSSPTPPNPVYGDSDDPPPIPLQFDEPNYYEHAEDPDYHQHAPSYYESYEQLDELDILLSELEREPGESVDPLERLDDQPARQPFRRYPSLFTTTPSTLPSELFGSTPCCVDRLSPLTCQRLRLTNARTFANKCNTNADFAFVQCCGTCFDRKVKDSPTRYAAVTRSLLLNQQHGPCNDRRGAVWCKKLASRMGFWEQERFDQLSCSSFSFAFRECRHSCGFCSAGQHISRLHYDYQLATDPKLCNARFHFAQNSIDPSPPPTTTPEVISIVTLPPSTPPPATATPTPRSSPITRERPGLPRASVKTTSPTPSPSTARPPPRRRPLNPYRRRLAHLSTSTATLQSPPASPPIPTTPYTPYTRLPLRTSFPKVTLPSRRKGTTTQRPTGSFSIKRANAVFTSQETSTKQSYETSAETWSESVPPQSYKVSSEPPPTTFDPLFSLDIEAGRALHGDYFIATHHGFEDFVDQ